MRERPEVVVEPSAEGEVKRKRIDLSVPQVAGSAVAAVVAAKLASYFGVYGTILGAGLVSVVATCGGSLFQHFFRRTGEQLREAQVRDAQVAAMAARATERTPPAPGKFTEGTVHRARIGSRRRPLVAAALVFGVTMAGITTYELVSGDSFSGDKGTTVSEAVTGSGSSSGSSSGTSDDEPATPSPSPATPSPSLSSTGDPQPAPSGGATSSAGDGVEDAGGATGGGTTAGTTPTPTATEGGAGTDDPAAPAPTESATTPGPSASSRSGTGGQDPAGPAAP
ncbi:hypothetical protein ACFWBB_18410 [Streptomyces sp. NPDC060000]|uniref:hypothetical protein n=1 Tax=Streptomyces sp. NPDC060000 TaxID=3347031 RepID=UPI0036C194D5